MTYFDFHTHAHPAASTAASSRSKSFETYILNKKDLQYFVSILPVNTINNSTAFAILITTAVKVFNVQFYCKVWYNSLSSEDSNHVPVTVTFLFPPTLSSSVTHIELNQPFTLTCSLPSSFSSNNKNYNIAFYNGRDGVLAYYEVNGIIIQLYVNF